MCIRDSYDVIQLTYLHALELQSSVCLYKKFGSTIMLLAASLVSAVCECLTRVATRVFPVHCLCVLLVTSIFMNCGNNK